MVSREWAGLPLKLLVAAIGPRVDAAAVLFQGDSNAYIGQSLLGSNRSLAWVPMPPSTVNREGIVVNVIG